MKNMKKFLLTVAAMLTLVFAMSLSVSATNKLTIAAKKINGTNYICAKAEVPAKNANGAQIQYVTFIGEGAVENTYQEKSYYVDSIKSGVAKCTVPLGNITYIYSNTAYVFAARAHYVDGTNGKWTAVKAYDYNTCTGSKLKKGVGCKLSLPKGKGISKYVVYVKKNSGSYKKTKTVYVSSSSPSTISTTINKVGTTKMSSGAATYKIKVYAYTKVSGTSYKCAGTKTFTYKRYYI